MTQVWAVQGIRIAEHGLRFFERDPMLGAVDRGLPRVYSNTVQYILNSGRRTFLCLLLIRPIGSRRSPEVFVMEPTHAWDLRHPALTRRLHAPWRGLVLGQ